MKEDLLFVIGQKRNQLFLLASMKGNFVFQLAANGPDCSEICPPLFLLCKLSSFIVRSYFIPKVIKGTKTKNARNTTFKKKDFSSCRVTKNPTLKVSSCKKCPNNTENKIPIENCGVLAWNGALITFG